MGEIIEIECPHCKGRGHALISGGTLSDRLRAVREARGFGLRATAGAIDGLSAGGLSNIETGRSKNPSIHTIKALADIYHVSVDDLLNASDS